MHLTSVSLPVLDLGLVAAFYRDLLSLDVTSSDNTAHAHVGATRLELRAETGMPAAHHLAFTIPTGKFTAAKAWLRHRTALLVVGDGRDEFDSSPSWNARSMYFEGPENAVLELIERCDLDNTTVGAFSAADLLSISEVGIAVPDVRATAQYLQRSAGIAPYGDEPGGNFAAVGDVHGLLILVSPGRSWFPTTHRRAAAVSTSVHAANGRPGDYPLTEASLLRLSQAI